MKDIARVLGAEGNILLCLSQILIDELEAGVGLGAGISEWYMSGKANITIKWKRAVTAGKVTDQREI